MYLRLLIHFKRWSFFTNPGLMEFQVCFLDWSPHLRVIDDFRLFWTEHIWKCSILMLMFLKASFYSFLLYINDLLDVIFNTATCWYYSLLSECDQVSHYWQQLEFASEFQSDLHGTQDWSRKWFVDSNAGNQQQPMITTQLI